MTGVITSVVDCGDGVVIGGNTSTTSLQTNDQHRTDFDQLQAVSGGATAIEYGLMAQLFPRRTLVKAALLSRSLKIA